MARLTLASRLCKERVTLLMFTRDLDTDDYGTAHDVEENSSCKQEEWHTAIPVAALVFL
jgi:hypothetical protein